jgi:hypothetical protein
MRGRQGINVPPGNVVAATHSPTTIGSTHTATPRANVAIATVPEAS